MWHVTIGVMIRATVHAKIIITYDVSLRLHSRLFVLYIKYIVLYHLFLYTDCKLRIVRRSAKHTYLESAWYVLSKLCTYLVGIDSQLHICIAKVYPHTSSVYICTLMSTTFRQGFVSRF